MLVGKFKPLTCDREVDYIEELLEGTLHLSDWTELNDIWEGVYKVAPSKCCNGFNSNQPIGDKLYGLKKRFGTFSFSREEKRRRNILLNHGMWAHYASNHRGVVVEFDLSKLKRGDLRSKGYRLVPIKYQQTYSVLKPEDVKSVEDDVEGNEIYRMAECLLSSKHRDWAQEQEVRLIVRHDCNMVTKLPIGGRDHHYFHLGCSPCRIITGSRYFENDEKLRKRLEDTCKRHGIRIDSVSDLYKNDFLNEDDFNSLECIFYHS